MSFSKPKKVKVPKQTDEEIEAERQRQALAARNARGRQSTILTSSQGARGGSVTRPTILGG